MGASVLGADGETAARVVQPGGPSFWIFVSAVRPWIPCSPYTWVGVVGERGSEREGVWWDGRWRGGIPINRARLFANPPSKIETNKSQGRQLGTGT